MKQFNNFLKKYLPFFGYFLISVIFLFPILRQNGVPFKYDWVWPIFDMQSFWRSLSSESSFGIISSFGKYATALLGIFGVLKISPTLSIKIFLLLIQTFSGYGFYFLLSKRIRSKPIAFLSGVVYAFSPYIFIRTIVGFTYSLIAYTTLPFFVDRYFPSIKSVIPDHDRGSLPTGKAGTKSKFQLLVDSRLRGNDKLKIYRKTLKQTINYVILAFLFSLIFSQIQAGLLLLLFLIVSIFIEKSWRAVFKNFIQFIFLILSIIVANLPWIIISLAHGAGGISASGAQATTLGYIANLPHSFRNVLMLSDHIITSDFFYPFAHNIWIVVGYFIVYLVAMFSVFSKSNRKLVFVSIISSLIILPFTIGPTGKFTAIFTYFYNHFPYLSVFRETYHFQFLLAFNLIFLFAIGFSEIINLLKKRVTKILVFLIVSASSLALISPYFDFNFRGYFRLQEIPKSYSQLYIYLKENKDYCTKIYYPPSLGFLHFSNDNSLDALNSDTIAWENKVPYVTDSASILSIVNDTYFERNYLTSLFLEQNNNGEFASALLESGADCVIVRSDLLSKYFRTTNVWRDSDPKVKQKWENQDMLTLAQDKVGLTLDKKFGENIYIYKMSKSKAQISNEIQMLNEDKVGKSPSEQFNNKATRLADGSPRRIQQLPLSDWANQNDWYVNGWARGRYNFWKKTLFARLKQDFIVTNKQESVLTGKIDYTGNYEFWGRVMDGGANGKFEIRISKFETTVEKNFGSEKFVWKKLGDVDLSGKTDVEIKNVSGQNAIADLVLVEP